MNSAAYKTIRAFLAILLLAAAAAPACVGSEDCSMPCCRNEPEPASHSHPVDGAAAPKPCCPQTAAPGDGMGAGCRFSQHHLALRPAAETGPTVTAAVFSSPFENRVSLADLTPISQRTDSNPPETPLYMRLQTFLI